MSILNFERLGDEKFEKLCKQIVAREYHNVKTLDGRGGDDGTDSFTGTINKQVWVFQFKYFLKVDSVHWKKIIKSLETSITRKKPKRWILFIPCEFTKYYWNKWEELRKKSKKIKLEVICFADLEKLVHKHKNALKDEYWSVLFPVHELVSKTTKETIRQLERGNIIHDTGHKIPYLIIKVNKSKTEDTLRQLSHIINVQLYDYGQDIPYVKFNGLETAATRDKVILTGGSGCGKSRTMFQLMIDRISSIKRVLIINPNLTANKTQKSLHELIDQIEKDDLLIWDNFPDGLEERNYVDAKKRLEMISSSKVNHLLISLNPDYLHSHEGIADEIPDIYSCNISFNKENIRSIIDAYGTNISRYTGLYIRMKDEFDLEEIAYV